MVGHQRGNREGAGGKSLWAWGAGAPAGPGGLSQCL